MVRTYVGIDPSYTGFAMVAYTPEHDEIVRGLAKTDPHKFSCQPHRLDHIKDQMLEFIDQTYPVLIAIEGYAYGSKNNREMAGELGGFIRWALWKGAYPYFVVAPTTLKKFATGSGKGAKDGMRMGVLEKWGYKSTDNNDADAYSLARLAHAFDASSRNGAGTKEFKKMAKQFEIVLPRGSDE